MTLSRGPFENMYNMKKITLFNRLKNKTINAFGILIVGGIVIGVLFAFGFIGTFLMKCFGLHYASIWDLLLFFICFFMIEFPFSFISANLPKVLNKYNIISAHTITALQLILGIMSAITILFTIDFMFKNISVSVPSAIIFSILYAVIDFFSKDK